VSTLLLTGPTWYDADGNATTGDVLLRDGVVAEVGSVDGPEGAETVDADGLTLLPGFVDLHTHLREPGREDAETIASGSRAAAVGGYTAVLAMANTSPVTDTAEAAERILDLGRAAGLVDVVPVGAVTKGLEGAELAELGLMHRSRAATRVFSDDGHCVADGRVMRRALEYVRAFDGVVSQHSQDPTLAGPQACCHEGEISGRLGLPGWPPVAEAGIIARDALLAQHTSSRVHVAHVSTAEGLDVVRWAKARGIRLTAEVTPHHLALGTELLVGYDPVYKVNPPLRPSEDRAALVEGLLDGTIDAIATDHAPHTPESKDVPFEEAPAGMLGVETALAVVLTTLVEPGVLTLAQAIGALSWQPARVVGLDADGHGGPIAVGRAANLCVIDPAHTWSVDGNRLASKSRNSPWDGWKLTGKVRHTIYRGTPTVRDQEPIK
jgi:dihydroorotase